jgi:hypothetical protein
MVGVTGQQGMLFFPGNWSHLWYLQGSVYVLYLLLIVPFTPSGHCFWLHILLFNWVDTLILNADYSVYMIWTQWFWLSTTLCVWIRAQGACNRFSGDACSSYVTDPTSDVYRGPCLPHSRICIFFRTYGIDDGSLFMPFHSNTLFKGIVSKLAIQFCMCQKCDKMKITTNSSELLQTHWK